MSASNGVIRIGHKGIKQFAMGEDGKPFDVDIVTAFQEWVGIDEQLRDEETGLVPTAGMPGYHQAAVAFVERLSGGSVITAEALGFIARLREQYDELAVFFQPRSPERPASPVSSAAELRFSAEPAEN